MGNNCRPTIADVFVSDDGLDNNDQCLILPIDDVGIMHGFQTWWDAHGPTLIFLVDSTRGDADG
jgi:hypothetical protein